MRHGKHFAGTFRESRRPLDGVHINFYCEEVTLKRALDRGSNWFGGVRLVAYPCSLLLAATSVLAFAPVAEGGPKAKAPVTWSWNGKDAWLPSGKAPSCGNVRMQPPAQVAALDGWLPPGRLNESARYYKAHGGLRFADPSANGKVVAAVDGYVVRGAAYRENRDGQMNGPGSSVQYLVDIQHPCGFLVRYDHLRTLSPALQRIFDRSIPVGEDSRTTNVKPVKISKGQVLATAVSVPDLPSPRQFDFGVYDLRRQQQSLHSGAWLADHGSGAELADFAVCWPRLMGSTGVQIAALPNIAPQDGTDIC